MALREYTGLWWLPEKPEAKVAGTLRIDEALSVELLLVGSFRGLEALQHSFELPLILGAGSGMLITLAYCFESGSNISAPGIATTRFKPGMTLLGAHVSQLEDIEFEKVYARYEHLEEWANRPGLRREFTFDEAGHMAAFTVSYAYPSKVIAAIQTATIEVVGGCSLEGNRWDAYVAHNSTRFRVTPSKPCSLPVLNHDFLHHIQNLVSLGAGRPVQLTELAGTLRGSPGQARNDLKVEILSDTREVRESEKQVFPDDMLFTLDDLADDFGGHLSRWLERAEVLSPIFNLYFGTLFGSQMYGEHQFLSLAQAAESYHRRTSPNAILPKPAWSKLRKELCQTVEAADIPAEAVELLSQKLSFLNEVSLKQRLRELLEAQKELVKFLIPDPERFVVSVADTRNYLTHFNRNLRKRAAHGTAMYRITEQLRFVIELVLLTELGISEEKKAKIVRRHQRYLKNMKFLTAPEGADD